MNFVITGHTQGIGKAIYNKFGGIGLSRSTGFDITKHDISPYLQNCDVFVNNAYDANNMWKQVDLVYEAKNISRQIVIGSTSSNFAWTRSTSQQNVSSKYATFKLALEVACQQVWLGGQNITLIKPGYVDTRAVQHIDEKKINPKEIAELIEFICFQSYKIPSITLHA